MKWSIVGLIIMGVVAASASAILVASIRSNNVEVKIDPAAEQRTVLVAARDLRELTVVDASGLEEKKMRKSEIPTGAIVVREQIIGQVLSIPVVKGQPLTRRCFAPKGPGKNLASILRPGMRALSISLSASSGMQGLLYPGSLVDVLASFKVSVRGGGGRALSTTLLQGIPVLAIENETVADPDEKDDAKKTKSTRTAQVRSSTAKLKVTLMLTPRQAEAMQLATQYGSVTLAMRNPRDIDQIDAEATLLNEGRMAKLAEFLESTVDLEDEVPGRVPREVVQPGVAEPTQLPVGVGPVAAAPSHPAVAPAAALPTKPAKPAWNVTILRGDKIEIRSFDLPDSGRAGDGHIEK